RISAMTSIDNTPVSPAQIPDGYTPRGGNYWTLFTPEIWKVLHAVLQDNVRKHILATPPSSPQAKCIAAIF
ncbi:MAG: hypothetical protein Q7V00_01415, partial [Sulfurimicrobium sp.]|nr:hypothetical protein [Sulfurimicrobium sp.]MDP3686678.1 hypothetical protein [Sulfurimicrobium sp.]